MTEPHVSASETEAPAKTTSKRSAASRMKPLNVKRRQRYQTDPEYAEAIRRKVRENKRDPIKKNPSANLGRVAEFGTVRQVEGRGEELTFTYDQIAKLVEFHPMVIRRWIDTAQIPFPVVQAAPVPGDKSVLGRELVPVYTLAEAEAILTVMADHLSRFRYFRIADIETIDTLHRAIKEARKG